MFTFAVLNSGVNTQSHNQSAPGTAVTIGNFDGVHRGHRALIERCRSVVGADGRVVVLAFHPHPMSELNPEQAPTPIEPYRIRVARLQSMGADSVVELNPTPELLGMSAQAFLDEVIDHYRPSVIVEGHDFRFGKRRAGTPTVLKELASLRGVRVEIVPAVEIALTDQSIVAASSTMTRWLIAHGRVRDAGFMLARPHELIGTVVRGDQLGRQIGFRTANLSTESMLPCDAVYSATVVLPDGNELGGAVNVGTRPTVDGTDRRAEVHIFKSEGQAWTPEEGLGEYGWPITVRLIGWVRDQMKFASVEGLIGQIGRDVRKATRMVEPMLGEKV